MEKWEASSWAKKMARKTKRASMTDFDRFKVWSVRWKSNVRHDMTQGDRKVGYFGFDSGQ